MTSNNPKTVFYLIILWAVCQCVTSQTPRGKAELQLVIAKMNRDLTEVEESINGVTQVEMSDYFDEATKWRLLPQETFRQQLLECSVSSGYLAFQHLLFDQASSYLPAKVFYATFNTQYVNDNFSTYEQRCKIWIKNKLTNVDHDCNEKLPAICLTPTQISRSEALMHNWAGQMFPQEIRTFQAVLTTVSDIITQGVPAKMLFEEDYFASTLLQQGEALRECKTQIASQLGLLQQPTFVGFQNLRFQMFSLVQRVLAASLQSWSSLQEAVRQLPSGIQSTSNGTDSSIQVIQRELIDLRQNLSEVRVTLEDESRLSGELPDRQMPQSSPPKKVTNAFCKSFFADCRTKIFPSDRSLSIENLLKYSFVNFYVGVGWSVLMFLILVTSIIYTCRQHLKVKRLCEHIVPTKSPVEQPLLNNSSRVDMTKLETALNRLNQQ